MTKSNDPPIRRPAAFPLDPEPSRTQAREAERARKPQAFDADVILTPDEEDPFLNPVLATVNTPPEPVRKRFSFAKVAAVAFGTLLSLAVGLWVDALIRDLFTRSDWLGYAALAVLAIGVAAVLGIVIRETAGMMRLAAVQRSRPRRKPPLERRGRRGATPCRSPFIPPRRQARNRQGSCDARGDGRRRHRRPASDPACRARIARPARSAGSQPHFQCIQARFCGDGGQPARARRSSLCSLRIGTAGARHGRSLWRSARHARHAKLMRDVLAHLAVTGSIAVGDSLVQQIARSRSCLEAVGAARRRRRQRAYDGPHRYRRHGSLPSAAVQALKRPGISDFIGDLTPRQAPVRSANCLEMAVICRTETKH